jgi:hypothetical protein
MLTPYQYASNSPIGSIDLDGLEALPVTEKNQYGEKQVYELTTGWTDGFVSTSETHKVYPSHAKPISQNMSDKQLYRLVTARMLVPGGVKISDNQYLDEKYFEAEERIKYYFSYHATAMMAKGAQSDKLTAEIHNSVVNGLFSDDPTMSDGAVTMIDRRTSFLGKFNWGKTAIEFGAGSLIAGGFKLIAGSIGRSLQNLGIPKGFGVMADAGKFRIASGTLNEQIALKEAMSGNAGDRLTATHSTIAGGAPKVLTDPRLQGLNITKYEYSKKIYGSDGKTVVENITIHYLQNNTTGQRFDFKFTQQ